MFNCRSCQIRSSPPTDCRPSPPLLSGAPRLPRPWGLAPHRRRRPCGAPRPRRVPCACPPAARRRSTSHCTLPSSSTVGPCCRDWSEAPAAATPHPLSGAPALAEEAPQATSVRAHIQAQGVPALVPTRGSQGVRGCWVLVQISHRYARLATKLELTIRCDIISYKYLKYFVMRKEVWGVEQFLLMFDLQRSSYRALIPLYLYPDFRNIYIL